MTSSPRCRRATTRSSASAARASPAASAPALALAGRAAGHEHGNGHHAGVDLPMVAAPPGIWGRLLGLVRPWWRTQTIVFLLGLLHAAAVVGLAVIGSLLVRQVAQG